MSADTRARLAALLAGPDADLAEANLLVAAEAHPGLDLAHELGRVEALAAAARARGGGAAGVADALRAAGLHGDRETYDDPENSFINRVLDRRRGLPIALSALTVAVGARAGVPLAGIAAPGHFVVADLSAGGARYLDAFDGWAPMDEDGLRRRVAEAAGVALRPEHLRPAAPRDVVLRMLANLEGSYRRRARPADRRWTLELALVAAPGAPDLRARLAGVLVTLGRYDEAEGLLDGLIAGLPPGAARRSAESERATIAEMRLRMN